MSSPIPEPTHAFFWFDVATAFIGAFFGAGLAFASNAWNERRKRRRDNLAAGNLALSILQRQLHAFFNVRKGFLADRAGRFETLGENIPKWMHFKPLLYTFSYGIKFDFQPLAFLFEQGDTDVVDRLAQAENRYMDLAEVVKHLNDTVEILQKRLVELGVADGVKFNVVEIEAQLGPALVGKVSSFTDALVKRFDEDEADYKAAAASLRAALLKTYKSKEVIRLVPVPGFNRLDWGEV